MYINNFFIFLLPFFVNAKVNYKINETTKIIQSKVHWMKHGEFEIACAAANVGFLGRYFQNPVELHFTKWSKWSLCNENCTKSRIRECKDTNKCGQCEITQEKLCSMHEHCHRTNIKDGLIRLKFYQDVDNEQKRSLYIEKSKEKGKESKKDRHKGKRLYTKWTNWTTCSSDCLTYRTKKCLMAGKCLTSLIIEKAYCFKFAGSRCFKLLNQIKIQMNNSMSLNVNKPPKRTTPRSIVITPHTTTTQPFQSRRPVTQTARLQTAPSIYSTTINFTHTPTYQSQKFTPSIFTSSLDPRFTSSYSSYTPTRYSDFSLNSQSSYMPMIGSTYNSYSQPFSPTIQSTQRSTLQSMFTPDFYQKFTPNVQTAPNPTFTLNIPNINSQPALKPIGFPHLQQSHFPSVFMPTTQMNSQPTTLMNSKPTINPITNVTNPVYTTIHNTIFENNNSKNKLYNNASSMNNMNLNDHQRPLAVSQPITNVTSNYTLEQKLRNNCGILENDRSSRRSMLKIIGGVISKRGQWPWQVALINAHREFVCGGTLIAPNWVLTAAHCVRIGLSARLNEYDLRYVEGPERQYRVQKAIIQYHFNKHTVDNDIALLKLSKEVQNQYACLPVQNENPVTNKMCTVIGWGRTNAKSNRGTSLLHETEIPIVPQFECKFAHHRHLITKNMFCAGLREGGRDTCGGDSGGPLLCKSNNIVNNKIKPWVIYGVTSFGDGCGRKRKYGIYTNVSNYINWIFKIMKKYQS